MGITGTGTLVITFTGSYGLTLDAGQYPLYLDWDGEAVRIDAPPGGVDVAADGDDRRPGPAQHGSPGARQRGEPSSFTTPPSGDSRS
jgi:hypothetical protein